MKERPTVALQMIVKDELQSMLGIIAEATPYFDEINLTVTDKSVAKTLADTKNPKVHVEQRDWNGKFDDARNDNLKMCHTDYFFWLDADDSFDFRAIPEIVRIADESDIDAIFLPYNYLQDEYGNTVTRHWRERLLKSGRGFTSRGWVHETFISDEKYTSHKINNPEVKHTTTFEDTMASHARNHEILLNAYEETADPRYLHYLGMSYYTLQNYNKAAELLSDYLQVGGSLEDSYRSMSVISECAYHLGKHDLALEYATKCTVLKPSYPQGYWLLAQYEHDQGNYEEALEWTRVGLSKPDPDSLGVYDPSQRERAVLLAADAEFRLTHFNLALGWLKKIPKNPTANDLFDDFKQEADAETFVELLPRIRKFFASNTALYEALCDAMKYDLRLKTLRDSVTNPKKWGKDSIVIFCGQGFEEWGPQTLEQGMGGSEEAIVYLAPELAKLGYDVTVFGEAEGEYDGVSWKPWKEIDTRDIFNIFVAWRAPQYLDAISAKVKLADLHDVLPPELVTDRKDVTYLVKSNYHRSLTPDTPDERFRVIGNGIKKEQFK